MGYQEEQYYQGYQMEELIPIVGMLADKYTSKESTSISYEKAQQLMDAVLYCIHEVEEESQYALVTDTKKDVKSIYNLGLSLVKKNVQKALYIYNRMMKSFQFYENICLRDTVIKGLPEFFRWYDYRFCPQNEILTLDYPVLCDLTKYNGIDKIYRYILCIQLEQKFLNAFPYQDVINILEKQNPEHRDMIENLCENVLENVLSTAFSERQDYIRQMDISELREKLLGAVERLIEEHYDNDSDLLEYLTPAVDNIVYRLKAVY